jgi:hydrogenase maturation factor
MAFLPLGKLRPDTLQALFDAHPVKDPRVVVGPRVGEDAAVIDVGDRYLVATTDPITFATDDLAWYALHVNANDVAVRGARPRWFLATLLLPEGATSSASVSALFGDLASACEEIDVALVGGHTEITHGLDRPMVVGTMLGEVAKDRLVTTGGAQVGDAVVLTKGVPLEGAAIIAREKEGELLARGVRQSVIARARRLLRTPGISVMPEAEIACELGTPHAMHDPTEGGVATALIEMAEAAGVGLRIDRDRIPLIPEGAELCRAFGLDPLGTIASGALLLAMAPAEAGVVVHALAREGIECHYIGQVVPRGEGVTLVEGSRRHPMPAFPQDEITKVFRTGGPEDSRTPTSPRTAPAKRSRFRNSS